MVPETKHETAQQLSNHCEKLCLEKAIGLRLLHRTVRRVEWTEAGQIYYERCRRIVDEARIAHEQLGEMLAQPSGVLRASLPIDLATIYLAPIILHNPRRHICLLAQLPKALPQAAAFAAD